jgi:hypothetical protein
VHPWLSEIDFGSGLSGFGKSTTAADATFCNICLTLLAAYARLSLIQQAWHLFV